MSIQSTELKLLHLADRLNSDNAELCREASTFLKDLSFYCDQKDKAIEQLIIEIEKFWVARNLAPGDDANALSEAIEAAKDASAL